MPDSRHIRSPRPLPGGGTAASALIITCEHGGNRIPPAFRALFTHQQALLDSHRGYDAGALLMANTFATAFHAPLLFSTTSRLLVDLNRTARHPKLHVEAVRRLPAAERTAIIERHHRPYHAKAERLAARAIGVTGLAIHVSCHSFTPVLDDTVRDVDIGLLYDPASPAETTLCKRWQTALQQCAPTLKVRRNNPYRGTNDGLTTWLRTRLPAGGYIGIELEINQRHVFGDAARWSALRQALVSSLRQVLPPPHERSPHAQPLRRIGSTPT